MATLDTELDLLLARKQYFREERIRWHARDCTDEPLYIAVRFTGELPRWRRPGFKLGIASAHRLRRHQPRRVRSARAPSAGEAIEKQPAQAHRPER